MRERDARFLIGELIYLALVRDDAVAKANQAARTLTDQYPREGSEAEPREITYSNFQEESVVAITDGQGAHRFRVTVTPID